MSIHAQLSPEVLEQLKIQKRNSTISSLVIAFLMLVLIGLGLGFVFLDVMNKETPTIVTYQSTTVEENKVQERRVSNQVQRQPSAPSSAMAKVIATTAPSPVAVPVPDVEVTTPSLDFGDGDDFGSGWGSGDGDGGGFGGIPETMKKRCSSEDRMQRLQEMGGTPEVEEAVVKGLQFFKKTQNADGSWAGDRQAAMTGLALLAYLGHCETPLSEEYGESCLKAIIYLVNLGMKNNGRLSTNTADNHWPYEHSIAAYALGEAATFCSQLQINVPNLDEAAMQAANVIVMNQHQSGSWDYSYDMTSTRGGDLSIAAWHVQALKALSHTGLKIDGLTRAANKAVDYVMEMQNKNGGFGYTSKDATAGDFDYYTLTGAGTLALQMWDRGNQSAARNGAKYIEDNTKFDYNTEYADLYGHYYEVQVMVYRGGDQWKKYNALFREQLLTNQNEDGSWKSPGGNQPLRAVAPQFAGGGSLAIHYRTALCVLMLESYYRFLPGTSARR